eukprot:gb/GECG01003349.1/.p1 GENE.gb/GECG01003349.1/~~gb/GECG01003349.1/.p1  ORF type:complete len:284 (+),score=38.18 gb/GECG01003349.1/:1-852(+)
MHSSSAGSGEGVNIREQWKAASPSPSTDGRSFSSSSRAPSMDGLHVLRGGSIASHNGSFLDDEEEDGPVFSCKVLMLGESGVGKSSIVSAYHWDTFSTSIPSTIAVDYVQHKQYVPNHRASVLAEIWDTAGQEQYRAVTRTFYRGLCAAMVVFSLTDEESFKKCSHWIREVREHAGDDVGIMLVGNKSDLKKARQVNQSDAQFFARAKAVEYAETSAKNKESVEWAFQNLLDLVYPALKDRKFREDRKTSSWQKDSRRLDRELIRESMRQKEHRESWTSRCCS